MLQPVRVLLSSTPTKGFAKQSSFEQTNDNDWQHFRKINPENVGQAGVRAEQRKGAEWEDQTPSWVCHDTAVQRDEIKDTDWL